MHPRIKKRNGDFIDKFQSRMDNVQTPRSSCDTGTRRAEPRSVINDDTITAAVLNFSTGPRILDRAALP